jgi:hypothetical protein
MSAEQLAALLARHRATLTGPRFVSGIGWVAVVAVELGHSAFAAVSVFGAPTAESAIERVLARAAVAFDSDKPL